MKLHFARRIVAMVTCALFSASSYAMDDAAACNAAMIGTFTIVEKTSAHGSKKTDEGDLIKIFRNGKANSFSFLSPDGKATLDDDGKPYVGELLPMDPEKLFKSFTGNEEDNIAKAKKGGFIACGLEGQFGYFVRATYEGQTIFTGNFGGGFGFVAVTLERAK